MIPLHILLCIAIVHKPFEPMFIIRKKSKYAEKHSFVTVNQMQALSHNTDDLEA